MTTPSQCNCRHTAPLTACVLCNAYKVVLFVISCQVVLFVIAGKVELFFSNGWMLLVDNVGKGCYLLVIERGCYLIMLVIRLLLSLGLKLNTKIQVLTHTHPPTTHHYKLFNMKGRYQGSEIWYVSFLHSDRIIHKAFDPLLTLSSIGWKISSFNPDSDSY